jgi:NitT/TauT family transport system ATP-binding protein
LPAPELLSVRGVTLRYATEAGTFTAVEDVSFGVREGERFVVLGPSGCGKSTLLKSIAGFVLPAQGTVELAGRPVERPGPDRVVVFQEFDQLLPWRTVLGNVVWPLRVVRGLDKKAALSEALRVLQLVGLDRFAGSYPHQLSGGMKQRAAIARSLSLDPRVLLMDEPFASLDALSRAKLQDELLAIFRIARRTLVFVTHSLEEAVLLGERILVLTQGPGRVRDVVDNAAAAGSRVGAAAAEGRRHLEELLGR